MKAKHFILILSLVLFSSCIVKSLKPFYLKEHIKFNKNLVGNWTTGKSSTWEIVSFKEAWKKENKDNSEISEEEKKAYKTYKDSYFITYTSSEKEAMFIAMPFMVGEHLFLDFTPFEYQSEDLNSLAAQHLLKTHSAAFVDFQDDGSVKLRWLDESVVSKLIDENKIRIKHEITGIDEDFVLTATSEELYRFLEKFMTPSIENKWDKDSTKTLKPVNAQP
ncbi:hypothetical protein J4050_06820 [Winogradskyella sp. DF17]|jgi:hypothetical protein|uniref:Lipoprotein n=1 Tax=Winogradskyella pelagia TaxID=2819984 RepID=A0ABS3T137_9FLAO|nr:hypothetical protein [Winogradskyella sp. DF17]MBO3116452.1 hypothetical protein [Winogradskyella sp. DF17]